MEQGIDLQLVLETLKKQVAEEKSRLDYILKGAELLAEMLTKAAKQNEARKKQPEIEYSQPGMATEQEGGASLPLYSAP